eukprot:7377495-Prymnesium_polylepis.1
MVKTVKTTARPNTRAGQNRPDSSAACSRRRSHGLAPVVVNLRTFSSSLSSDTFIFARSCFTFTIAAAAKSAGVSMVACSWGPPAAMGAGTMLRPPSVPPATA